MFRSAEKNKLVLENPAIGLKKPVAKNATRRGITDAERNYILQVAQYHTNGLFFELMLYCGLRPREIPPIQGINIDFKNGILKVTGSKTKAGIRSIPITIVLLEKLKHLEIDHFGYLIKNKAGRKLTASNMRSMWESFRRELNIAMGCKVYRNQAMPPYRVADDLVPYCLRHTYCTDLQAVGVPINVAKELMGNTDISVTARIYTHYSDTAFNNAADLINKHQSKTTPTPIPTSNVWE